MTVTFSSSTYVPKPIQTGWEILWEESDGTPISRTRATSLANLSERDGNLSGLVLSRATILRSFSPTSSVQPLSVDYSSPFSLSLTAVGLEIRNSPTVPTFDRPVRASIYAYGVFLQ